MLRRTLVLLVGLMGLGALLVGGGRGNTVERGGRGDGQGGARPAAQRAPEVRQRRQGEDQDRGPIEVITQRIVAEPGATFGWHSHPGENVNVVLQGTLTLYHDEACTKGIAYGPGTSFKTSPDEIHLARNLGGDQLVFFATYVAPKTTPPLPVRIDQPLPRPGCPQ